MSSSNNGRSKGNKGSHGKVLTPAAILALLGLGNEASAASGDEYVQADSIKGVARVKQLSDGSVELVFENGDVVKVAAKDVQVQNGNVLVSAEAVEQLAGSGALNGVGKFLADNWLLVGAGVVGAAVIIDNNNDDDGPSDGNDNLVGSAMADAIDGLAGDDNIQGLAGDDSLTGGDGNDTLDGGTGNDTLVGNAGNDELLGGAGDDVLRGGGGADINNGGDGIDTADFSDIGSGITADLGAGEASYAAPNGNTVTDTLVSIENLTGSDSDDSLTGDANANTLSGGAGNDTLVGGGGADTLLGGSGDDVLRGGGGPDTTDGGEGSDTADFSDIGTAVTADLGAGSASYAAPNGNTVTDTLVSIENIIGSNNDDNLTGDAGANRLDGGMGNDTLVGGGGADTLIGGAGNDVLRGGGGPDTTDGGEGIDTADFSDIGSGITASLEDGEASYLAPNGNTVTDTLVSIENIIGSNSDDSLTGDSGANVLDGGMGNDSLVGGGGADTLIGGAGNDVLRGGGGPDTTDGGEGIDTADFSDIGSGITASLEDGEASYQAPNGNTVTDTLVSIENLTGSNSDDSFTGDSGANVFSGGLGSDTLNGGDGVDTADYSDLDVPVTVNVDGDGNGTVTRETGFSVAVENVVVNPAMLRENAMLNPNLSGNFVTEAAAGNLYFNIHTTDFPGGEIRGQLDTIVSDTTVEGVRTLVLSATLDAAQEPGPTSDSNATGEGTVTIVIDGDSITYSAELSVTGIATSELMPVAGFSAIHLHNNVRGENGPVVLDLVQDAGGDVNGAIADSDVFDEVVETDTLTSIEIITGANDNGVQIVGDNVDFVNDSPIDADNNGILVNGNNVSIDNSSTIDGAFNGVNFAADSSGGSLTNSGTITSASRGVNISGDGVTVNNSGTIVTSDDPRNGVIYSNETADNVTINNSGTIDAGEGNNGDGVSLQLSGDDNHTVTNSGSIVGRGDVDPESSANNQSSGVRLFTSDESATFSGSISNEAGATISSEAATGPRAGVIVQNNVNFQGDLSNAGTISGVNNGLYFGTGDHTDGVATNEEGGVISSDSRAVNIDGDGLTFVNNGSVLGTGDQRNGTIYSDGTANNYTIINRGLVDAGEGSDGVSNNGAAIALQLGAEGDTNVEITNSGTLQGRGQGAADQGVAGDGLRLFTDGSTFTGDIINIGTIDSESAVGPTAGVRFSNGVNFQGELSNLGEISGVNNGLYFGTGDHSGGVATNEVSGTISSDSRAVNIDGDGLTFVNEGRVLGTGDQRNGTIYADGTANNYTIDNSGLVDAGEGNNGAAISLQLAAQGDTNATIINSGDLLGRGQAAAGENTAGDGLRLFTDGSTFVGSIDNSGSIDSESDQGATAGVRFANGVNFQGTLNNSGTISGDNNGLYFGTGDHTNGVATNAVDGVISSDSRAVNIDGDGLTFVNQGTVLGTGDQRNGTIYSDSTANNFVIDNSGLVDAGDGNNGAAISLQLSAEGETSADILNTGDLQGRGQAAASENTAGDGLRLFNAGSTFVGEITNDGVINSESGQGATAGVRIANGVNFQGELTNNGVISGVNNGLYFGVGDHAGSTVVNSVDGIISSDSRAVNLDGDNLSFENQGDVIGTGDQRNGTVYVDGTADGISIENSGTIDAGEGNSGSGVSTQVGSAAEDAVSDIVDIDNSGTIQARGEGEVNAGVRFFNGSGEDEAELDTVIENSGLIASESAAGILIEDGVNVNGSEIVNQGTISGGNGIAIDASGASGELDVDSTDGILEGDVLLGSGNDSFRGSNGDDVVSGGLGDDSLDGGAGLDTADFSDLDVPVDVTVDAMGNGAAIRETGFSVAVDNVAVDPAMLRENATLNPDLSNDFITEAEAGNLYFNIHTNDFNGGEIRGQLDTVVSDNTAQDGTRTLVLSATLDAAQEPGPTSDSEATGEGTLTIIVAPDGSISYSADLSVTGLATSDLLPVAGFSAIHIHNNVRGENGPVVLDVVQDAGGDVNGSDVFVEVTETDTLTSIENIIGSDDGDSITATGSAANVFDGRGGDDTLIGGGGADTLIGGEGDDTLQGGGGPDTIDGGEGSDTISFADIAADVTVTVDENGNGTATYLAPNGETVVTDTFTSIENFLGTNVTVNPGSSDTLNLSGFLAAPVTGLPGTFNGVIVDLDVNSAGANGTPGQDGGFLNAPPGAVAVGGVVPAANILNEIDDFENVIGTDFNDGLFGNNEVNVLNGGAGNDAIHGFAGNDFLQGGAGIDTVLFSAAPAGVTVDLNDQVDAATFDDIVAGDAAAVAASSGGAGLNVLSGFENVTGSQNADTLIGDDNANVLNGNGGNDSLDGSAGNDTLIGGAGLDSFVVREGSDADTVTDFDVNDDVIEVVDLVDDAAAALALAVNNGEDTVIDFGNGDVITLTGVDAADLTEANFAVENTILAVESAMFTDLSDEDAAVPASDSSAPAVEEAAGDSMEVADMAATQAMIDTFEVA
ncbi:beta strand repeat-containing protein [Porticoccus sp. GXU_MW_L64]